MTNISRYVVFQEKDFNILHKQMRTVRQKCTEGTESRWQEWLGTCLVRSFDAQAAGICDASQYLAGLIEASDQEGSFDFVMESEQTRLTVQVVQTQEGLFGCVYGSPFFVSFLSHAPHQQITKNQWNSEKPGFRELRRLKKQDLWHQDCAFYAVGETDRPKVIAKRTDIGWTRIPTFSERTNTIATLLLYKKFIDWDMQPKLDVIAKESCVSREDVGNLDPGVINHLSHDLWVQTNEGQRMFKKEREFAARILKPQPSMDEIWPKSLPKSF